MLYYIFKCSLIFTYLHFSDSHPVKYPKLVVPANGQTLIFVIITVKPCYCGID